MQDRSLVEIHPEGGPKRKDPYGELKILAGTGGREFGAKVAASLGVECLSSEVVKFSEGSLMVRVRENVRGRDVYLIQGIEYPVNDNWAELLFWIDALKRSSACQVTAVIPFFAYAKGDKKDEPRVSIRARVCADTIEKAGADRVLFMDLHAAQVQGFFSIPVDHLYAEPVLVDYFRHKEVPNLVCASPDVGFVKGVYRYAEALGVDVVIGNKRRRGHDEKAEILDVIGEVRGKNVLIVDDFTISGGTLINMAAACKAKGARDIYACVTHAVFSQGSAAKVAASAIKEMVVTDTISHRFEPLPPNVRVVSVASLFGEAIRSIHERESVSRLF